MGEGKGGEWEGREGGRERGNDVKKEEKKGRKGV